MKLSVDKKEFLRMAAIAGKAVPGSATLRILANEKMDFILGNTSSEVVVTGQATVEVPGNVEIAVADMFEIARKMPSGEFTLEKTGPKLTITAGKIRFALVTVDSAIVGPQMTITEGQTLTVDGAAFHAGVMRTVFAAGSDEGRPIFTGILFDAGEHGLNMVGTNTHHMAIARVMSEKLAESKVIVPHKVAASVAALTDIEKPMMITWDKGKVSFKQEGFTLTAMVISGAFPDYSKVIPVDNPITAYVERESLVDALERVKILMRKEVSKTTGLQFASGSLTLSAESADVGDACEEIEAEVDQEFLIHVNVGYLLAMLKVCDPRKIRMDMKTALTPAKITAVGDDDFTYVLTPVRTAATPATKSA